MKRHISILSAFLVAMVTFILSAAAPEAWAGQIPFSQAKIIFEFNSSGPDLGIQVSLDGEPWNEIMIVDPKGHTILEIEAAGRLTNFGLTELFAESNEPNFADVPAKDILARFPAGVYKFFGKTVEGDKLVGTATLTHAIPNGPEIVSPLENNVVDPDNTVIRWKAPKGSLTGRPFKIVAYQVVVDGGDPSRRFDVTVSGNTTSVQVPPQFLEADTEYLFEVLAIEAGGNQTITEGGPFKTMP